MLSYRTFRGVVGKLLGIETRGRRFDPGLIKSFG